MRTMMISEGGNWSEERQLITKLIRKEGKLSCQKLPLATDPAHTCMMCHSWGQSAVAVASSGVDVLSQWPWSCRAATGESCKSNTTRPWPSFQGQNQILLGVAPGQAWREEEEGGKSDCLRLCEPTLGVENQCLEGKGGRGLLHYSSKEQFETKEMTVRVFPVDGGYVMQWWCSCQLHSGGIPAHHHAVVLSLWLQRCHGEAGSGETSSRSPGGRLGHK